LHEIGAAAEAEGVVSKREKTAKRSMARKAERKET
jgi:hypothetical protein